MNTEQGDKPQQEMGEGDVAQEGETVELTMPAIGEYLFVMAEKLGFVESDKLLEIREQVKSTPEEQRVPLILEWIDTATDIVNKREIETKRKYFPVEAGNMTEDEFNRASLTLPRKAYIPITARRTGLELATLGIKLQAGYIRDVYDEFEPVLMSVQSLNTEDPNIASDALISDLYLFYDAIEDYLASDQYIYVIYH